MLTRKRISRPIPALLAAPLMALTLSLPIGCGDPAPVPPRDPTDVRQEVPATGSLRDAGRLHAEAEALLGKGRMLEALPKAERALAIRQTRLAPEDPAVASSLDQVGRLLMNKDARRGEAMLRRALAIREKTPQPDDREIATVLGALADATLRLGSAKEAERLARQAVERSRRTPGERDLLMARSLTILSGSLLVQGRLEEAGIGFRRVMTLLDDAAHPDGRARVEALIGLCEVSKYQGALAEARKSCDEAIEVSGRTLGPHHPVTADALRSRALLHVHENQYENARPLLQQSIAVTGKSEGPDAPRMGDAVSLLGRVEVAGNRPDRAEPLYRRALGIYQDAYSEEHPRVATVLQDMAMLQQFQHKFANVEPLYRRALRIREKTLGPSHPDTAETMALLGIFYVMRGNCPRGSALVAKAIPILENDPFRRTRLAAQAREARVLAEAWIAKNKRTPVKEREARGEAGSQKAGGVPRSGSNRSSITGGLPGDTKESTTP